MEIERTDYKRCSVVKVSGRVDSFTSPKLSEALKETTDAGIYKIALDLSNVDYVSSSGLRIMIDYQKNCKHLSRGEVVLINVPKRVKETLDLAGFVPLFKFFNDSTSAVASF
jgi:anti-anti-sigma factor